MGHYHGSPKLSSFPGFAVLPALNFVKELLYVQYETVLQRPRHFSLVRRRIRGNRICMYKIMHGLLDFPCDTVIAAPTHTGLRDHTFKIHQQRCKTRRRRSSDPVLKQTTRGDCERFIRGSIQAATGCMVAVPLPRSFPLTRPRHSLPNLFHLVVSHPNAISVIILGRL